MSATLFFEVVKPEKGHALSYSTKKLLGRKYCGTDGSTGHEFELSSADIPWLEGAAAASEDKDLQKDFDKILSQLNDGKTLRFWFEH